MPAVPAASAADIATQQTDVRMPGGGPAGCSRWLFYRLLPLLPAWRSVLASRPRRRNIQAA